jgi:hypothetical protein
MKPLPFMRSASALGAGSSDPFPPRWGPLRSFADCPSSVLREWGGGQSLAPEYRTIIL